MSSSLLLDNFVIQEQHQPTQNKASTYHFYNENEQEYFEQSSNYMSPPTLPSQPLIASVQPTSQTKLKKCTCCPYGFHIDLDFIRYCEELAANGKSPSRKQLDRRNKRRQRKSLEVMLGFDDQWVFDLEKELHPVKQQKSEFETVYEVRNKIYVWNAAQFSYVKVHNLFVRHNGNDILFNKSMKKVSSLRAITPRMVINMIKCECNDGDSQFHFMIREDVCRSSSIVGLKELFVVDIKKKVCLNCCLKASTFGFRRYSRKCNRKLLRHTTMSTTTKN